MAIQSSKGHTPDGIGTFKGYMMPPSMIDVDPSFNPRNMDHPDTAAHVASIADSIRARGFDLDRPLLGRMAGEKFIVTDGHCRFAAIRALLADGVEIKAIPVRNEPAGTSAADRLALTLRDPGRPLSPAESADAIKRLIAFGWTDDQVAAKLGKRKEWVKSCLDLAGAPEEIKTAVNAGEIAPTEAVRIIRNEADPVATLAAAKEKAAERGSERVRPRDIAAAKEPKEPTAAATTEALADMGNLVQRVLEPWQQVVAEFLAAWDDESQRDNKEVERHIKRLRELVA